MATNSFTFPLDNKKGDMYNIPTLPKKIGHGSYGQVYEAANATNVVKQVDKYNSQDKYTPSYDLHSLTELVVLKKTMFCNIPVIKNVSSSSEKIMIEMNNCGRTLYEFSKRLTFEQRCSLLPWVAHQLIVASLQLQANGIIHNDIKSANVLINDQLVVSLIDFGLCVFETVDDNNSCSLKIPKCWGTYTICPPEMFNRSDWNYDKMMPWSVGITLCEFLFSTHSFLRDYLFDIKQKKLYSTYIRFDEMMKSLMSFVFNKQIASGEKCIHLQDSNIPDNVVSLIARLLTFNPKTRISLFDALQLPIFHEYTTKCNIQSFTVPDIYYNKIQGALLENTKDTVYEKYRTCCIDWMYNLYKNSGRLHLFVHAVGIFDRFLSKVYIVHYDYILVACAAVYIAQFISKNNIMLLMYIVDRTYKVQEQFENKRVDVAGVKLHIEMILVVLDYDLYHRTLDTLLASQNVKVNYSKVCQVLTDTLPPYNNMILLRNYKKAIAEDKC
jgi:serine/threonine protein kinase